MSIFANMFSVIGVRLSLFFGGVAGLLRLVGLGLGALGKHDGPLKQRLASTLASPAGLRAGFAVLRAFVPNLVLGKRFISSYDNNGTAIVTRFRDVEDVLSNDDDFEVVYAPRMAEITAGSNFFLGMQNTPEYQRDVSNMRLAVRRTDVSEIVRPFVERTAAALLKAAPGRIDVPQDLSLRVPARLMGEYFGTPGPSERQMIDWTTIMFWYLFIDLAADPYVIARAKAAAAECRTYLDRCISERKKTLSPGDDVLNRCLAMQRAGFQGMDDLEIRNNLIGLIIGAVPTTSKAAILALDQLLERPEALAGAQRAALAGDDALLAAYVFEALRFNPLSPIVYRRAVRDTKIARNTLRARAIPKSTMVMAVTLSAMFDPARTSAPNAFRTDRDWNDYILWGYGLHTCFGAHINRVMIPAILKPLLAQKGLRRATGSAGQIDSGGTPFPVHFIVEFDA